MSGAAGAKIHKKPLIGKRFQNGADVYQRMVTTKIYSQDGSNIPEPNSDVAKLNGKVESSSEVLFLSHLVATWIHFSRRRYRRQLTIHMASFFTGRPGIIWRQLIFVRTLDVNLLMKNLFIVMIVSSGSILIKRPTRLLRTLMMQAQAVLLRNYEMKSGKFHSVVDHVLFAKAMETIVTKKYSFVSQSTRGWQTVLFVSQFAGTNMDIISI